MNLIRRSVLMIAVVLATLVGLTALPAQAAFTDSTAAATAGITTVTVAAPADMTARPTSCSSAGNRTVLLSWTASTSARISGYRVTVLDSAGIVLGTDSIGPTETSVSIDVDAFGSDPSTLLFTVTTLTDYGWTATSPTNGASGC